MKPERDTLKSYQGAMSFEEIARVLGITPTTVCDTYKRGMRKLRKRGMVYVMRELMRSKDKFHFTT